MLQTSDPPRTSEGMLVLEGGEKEEDDQEDQDEILQTWGSRRSTY